MSAGKPSVAIVIPTFNEEQNISPLLDHLCALRPDEVIIADGGSTDRTAEIAASRAKLVRCRANRGLQMNSGAEIATAEVLLFLHADVRLGPKALQGLREAMGRPDIVGGNFDVVYQGGDLASMVFTTVNRARRQARIFYGDSGIFCRRSAFEELRGYRTYPVLEDYEFARRMARHGRLALLNEPIYVSNRRWKGSSVVRTLWSWSWIQGLYWLGVHPERLSRWYRAIR